MNRTCRLLVERLLRILTLILRSYTRYQWRPASLPVHAIHIIDHVEDVPARRPAPTNTASPQSDLYHFGFKMLTALTWLRRSVAPPYRDRQRFWVPWTCSAGPCFRLSKNYLDCRSVLILAILVIVAFLLHPAILRAHEPGISDPVANSARGFIASNILAIPGIADLPRIALSEVKYIPSLKSGYRRMGMFVSVPVPFEVSVPGTESYKGDSVNLGLPDVNLWIIEAGIEARITPTLKLFVSGAGNLVQNLATSFTGYVDSEPETRLRRKYPLDWLEVEGGFVYYFRPSIGLVAGLKWDHFDMTVKEPEVLSRVNVGSYRNVSLLASDVLSDLVLPYLGVEYAGEALKLRLIGNVLGSAKVKVGTRFRADIAPAYNFLAQNIITMNSMAYFFEAGAEYRISMAAGTHLSLWGKGGWMTASGGGRLESGYSTTHPNLVFGILQDRDVVYRRYNLAGGVAINLSF